MVFASYIVIILSSLALFVPVFSGYVLGLIMLIMSILTRFSTENDSARKIRSEFRQLLAPISRAALLFWSLLLVAGAYATLTMDAFDQRALRQSLGNFGVKYVLLWFIYLGFWWRLAYVKNLWRIFTFSYALVAFIHLTYCIIQRQLGVDWGHGFNAMLSLNRYAYGSYRISGFVGHPLTLGYCQTLAVVSSIHFYLNAFDRWEKFAWLVAACSALLVVLLSGSRGPQVVVISGVLISIPITFFKKYWKQHVLIVVACLGLGVYLGAFERFLEIFTAGSGGDLRGVHWKVHWNIFLDHLLVGIGPGAFRSAISAYYFAFGASDTIKLAHNAFLQFAADFGLVGLAGVSVWLLSWMRVAKKSSGLRRAFRALFIVTMLGALSQNNVQDSTYVLSLTIWSMAIAANEVYRHESRRDERKNADPLSGESYSPSREG